MTVILVGLNHRTAPVEIREQLAFSRDGAATALMMFRNRFPKAEAAIISTCNRVEILVAGEGDSPSPQDVVHFIAQARDLPVVDFKTYLYQLSGEQACRHFFRVASGLDSMVLGENQIVSQIKQAYTQASEQGTTGRTLNRLFHHAFEVSKRLRTETQIGAGKLSIPSVAVDVASRIFDDFSTKQTLVGAGEMAQLVCQYLREASANKFVITTRTLTNAMALADACHGQAVPYDQLDEQLIHADIVITATACPMPIITAKRIHEAQKHRRGRLLFLIDLAVPRNVSADCGKLEQVYVIDVDELGRMVAENQKLRNGQLEICEKILDEEVAAFEEWLDSTQLNPLIEQMFRDAKDLCNAELQRLYRRCPDMDDEQRAAVEQLVNRLVGKFMHPCVSTLRRHATQSATFAGALHEAVVKR
ncbi:MAG TPA: glutamyl-tRNA reductase [Tepidisphaeraceae bacterium]|nr:glutamyl-tRNA reductase [Tepidisphaeraceae bacterium]